jgi:hypothetical protein
LYFYGRIRKRELNYSTDSEEMPPLPPPTQALEIRLDDNDDYMPDCPWKQHDFNYDSCENILCGYLYDGDLVFVILKEIYGFEFPKRFLEISSRDLTSSLLLFFFG